MKATPFVEEITFDCKC